MPDHCLAKITPEHCCGIRYKGRGLRKKRRPRFCMATAMNGRGKECSHAYFNTLHLRQTSQYSHASKKTPSICFHAYIFAYPRKILCVRIASTPAFAMSGYTKTLYLRCITLCINNSQQLNTILNIRHRLSGGYAIFFSKFI